MLHVASYQEHVTCRWITWEPGLTNLCVLPQHDYSRRTQSRL